MQRLMTRLLLAPAALLLVACAGCHGARRADDGWLRDAEWIGADAPVCQPWSPDAMSVRVSSDSSPFATLLSGLLPGKDEDEHFAHRPRVEPVPIVGEREIGFGFTVHW